MNKDGRHIPDDLRYVLLIPLLLIAFGMLEYLLSYFSQGIFAVLYELIATITFILAEVSVFVPYYKMLFSKKCSDIGLMNKNGMTPRLLWEWSSKENRKITILKIKNNGIPLETFESKQSAIEAALNCSIVKMEHGKNNSIILIYAISGSQRIPSNLLWNNKYLSKKDFELVLGRSLLGEVTVNILDNSHLLVAGATGSGKTALLKLLLKQAHLKGAEIYLADLKGGVDFPKRVWGGKAQIAVTEASVLEQLKGLVNELNRRTALLVETGCANIGTYNAYSKTPLPHIIFSCDEVAELLDKTGANKDRKMILSEIENALSTIARLGRAFGIHLFLSTQRPDAGVLPGQIKNNIQFRVCGIADNVLSQIILDNAEAASKIPKDAHGRFVLHDGTVFQGYWLDDKDID